MKSLRERAEKFLIKLKEIYKNEDFDYHYVIEDYNGSKSPVRIIDNSMGGEVFTGTPSNLLKGRGNSNHRAEKISSSKRMSVEEFIRRCKEVHKGENLDYSKVKLNNLHDMVTIIDHDLDPDGNEYGEYVQEANSHLRGHGHPRKAIDINSSSRLCPEDEMVKRIKSVHKGKDYDYSKVAYKGYGKKICIVCNKVGVNGKIHGEFWAMPWNLLLGKGCPRCGNHMSKGENEIRDMLKGENVVQGDHSLLGSRREIDLYLPEKNVAIEYNGLIWHSEKFGKGEEYHLEKLDGCKKKGVKLFSIFEDEWNNKKELATLEIMKAIGRDIQQEEVDANKVTIEEIPKELASLSIEKWHILGYEDADVHIGALIDKTLYAVMAFIKNSDNSYTLSKYAIDTRYFSENLPTKMFEYFKRKYKPTFVDGYLDRRWWDDTENNIFNAMGFDFCEYTKPDYTLTEGHGRCRFKKEEIDDNKTDYYRIYDCGLVRYVWRP